MAHCKEGCEPANEHASGAPDNEKGCGEPSDKILNHPSCCKGEEFDSAAATTSKNALRKLRAQKRLQEAKDRRKALRADAKRRKKRDRRGAFANKDKEPVQCPRQDAGISVRVCIDCEFEELQCESERYSLVQQLMYAYGDANRLNRLRDQARGTQRRWKSGWRKGCGIQQNCKEGTENCSAATASESNPALESKSPHVTPSNAEGQSITPVLPLSSNTEIGGTSPLPTDSKEVTTPHCQDIPPERPPAVEFCITGVGPKIQDALKRVQCNGRWKCEVCSQPFEQKFAQECATGQVVYLTADADEELQTLDPSTLYVVGGIVDRNRYKGLTLKKSREKGVKAAKLPISSKIGRQLEGSKILTVNQVVAVLIAYAELGDWTAAFNRALPPRKGADAVQKDNSPLEENVLLSV